MTQPTRFTITVDFSQEEANQVVGRSTVRTAMLDALFDSLKTTTDEICDNLALIQRDDTHLLDGVVELHSLSGEVLQLMSSTAYTVRGGWVTGTSYSVGDVVLQDGIVYLCVVAHTSGTFATDLNSGYWGQITANQSASTVSFAPTSTISASNVQVAIAELDTGVRPGVSIFHRELFNGL